MEFEKIKHIFRAYDIRGVFGKDLNSEVAEIVGKAFGTFIGSGKTVAIARDVRNSGPTLKDNLIKGIVSAGCNVIDAGMITTPILSFMIISQKLDGGVSISASHNPGDWNGFIMIKEGGLFCSEGFGMEKIREIISTNSFSKADQLGKISTSDILPEYYSYVGKKISLNRKLKVVLDTGNGATSLIAPKIFRDLGLDVIPINDTPDGNFPAHDPDVTENLLSELKEQVVDNHADFGIAFDCDGDRASFIDNEGRFLGSGNITIAIFAEHYLKQVKNSKIVFDLTCSSFIEEFVRSKGGIPIVSRVGHAYITNRMIEDKAIFGGEYSNHLYFQEMFGLDDTIFGGLKMAEILSRTSKSLSEINKSIPRYPSTDVEEIYCPDGIKFEVVEKLKTKIQGLGYTFLEIDGIKVLEDDGWVLIRPSNTLPSIKINAEARTEEKSRTLHDFAKNLVIEEIGKSS